MPALHSPPITVEGTDTLIQSENAPDTDNVLPVAGTSREDRIYQPEPERLIVSAIDMQEQVKAAINANTFPENLMPCRLLDSLDSPSRDRGKGPVRPYRHKAAPMFGSRHPLP